MQLKSQPAAKSVRVLTSRCRHETKCSCTRHSTQTNETTKLVAENTAQSAAQTKRLSPLTTLGRETRLVYSTAREIARCDKQRTTTRPVSVDQPAQSAARYCNMGEHGQPIALYT